MYIVPFPPGRGGGVFSSNLGRFSSCTGGKGRERRKGDEKTKREKKKGRKRDKKGRKGLNKEKKEGKFGKFFRMYGGKFFKMNGTIYIPVILSSSVEAVAPKGSSHIPCAIPGENCP